MGAGRERTCPRPLPSVVGYSRGTDPKEAPLGTDEQNDEHRMPLRVTVVLSPMVFCRWCGEQIDNSDDGGWIHLGSWSYWCRPRSAEPERTPVA